MTVASCLIAASALVILTLGLVHLLYTFRGTKLHPRDTALRARLETESPNLTRQTTLWKCWIGFNASHSAGAILFGLVYGDLALAHANLLFGSPILLGVGLAMLLGYAVLGKLYWFSIPHRSILVAGALYIAGLLVAAI
jgi:uncharacterized membrane protein